MTDEAGPRPATPAMWWWRAVIVLGWAMMLAGLAVFGWECVAWLRDGAWSWVPLADLWGRAPLGGDAAPPGWDDMRGLHMILHALLRLLGRIPISLALLVAGLAVSWTGNGRHERAERSLARRRWAR